MLVSGSEPPLLPTRFMAESLPHAQRLRDAHGTARQLFAEGVSWLVYELPPMPFDRRSSPSLVFENESDEDLDFVGRKQ